MKTIKKVLFDNNRAIDVFSVLSKLWVEKSGVFKNLKTSPNIPQITNHAQLAHFLFVLIMSERGPVVSERVFELFTKLWNINPDIFDPKKTTNINKGYLVKLFIDNHFIRNGENFLFKNFFEYWLFNFEVIQKNFVGNILNAFQGIDSFSQLSNLPSIKMFRGIQTKLLSYFVAILQEQNIIKYFPAPFPVDFHRLRILWSTDIINLGEFEQPLGLLQATKVNIWYTHNDQINIWSEDFFIKNHDFNHLVVGPAMWHFSRQMCSIANRKRRPLQTICSTCPIKMYCNWTIPSCYFYDGPSSLLVRHKRQQ